MKTKSVFSKIILTGLLLMIILNNCSKKIETIISSSGSVKDIDGNVYHTVAIGGQVWMVENLKTTKFRNGNDIPNITDGAEWGVIESEAYCWYNNDIANKPVNGALYNWYAVEDGRYLAPKGWHIPTYDEWNTLIEYLGGEASAGGKLKEAGGKYWSIPNIGATNESGFTALGSGGRNAFMWPVSGEFNSINTICYFWTSTKYSEVQGWYKNITYDNVYIDEDYGPFAFGFSIRCIKD